MRTTVRLGLPLAGVLALAAAGVFAWQRGAASSAGQPPPQSVATTTTPVVRGDVTERIQLSGTLGYDGIYPVIDQMPAGILTAVPGPGAVVVRGADLFAVSGTPVVLLYGGVPAYRDFVLGMSDGADVRELEENLVALGVDPGHAIMVDNHFSAASAAALVRWQAARRLPAAQRTGVLPLGSAVFLPGALRVDQTPVDIGAALGPGTVVLQGTSTVRVVTAPLPTDRQTLVHVGDAVVVSLPAAAPVTGTVQRIGRVASDPSAAPGAGGPATVPLTVTLQLPTGLGDLDQAPVQVAITAARHTGVLLVPVTALLARPGGGYQVRVLDAAGGRLVPVQPGLYDDATGTVEVTGPLTEGMRVEVPAS